MNDLHLHYLASPEWQQRIDDDDEWDFKASDRIRDRLAAEGIEQARGDHQIPYGGGLPARHDNPREAIEVIDGAHLASQAGIGVDHRAHGVADLLPGFWSCSTERPPGGHRLRRAHPVAAHQHAEAAAHGHNLSHSTY